MNIINIVEIVNNEVLSVESFVIEDEQLSGMQVESAERLFIKLINERLGVGGELTEDQENDYIEEGYYGTSDGYSINLVWSH